MLFSEMVLSEKIIKATNLLPDAVAESNSFEIGKLLEIITSGVELMSRLHREELRLRLILGHMQPWILRVVEDGSQTDSDVDSDSELSTSSDVPYPITSMKAAQVDTDGLTELGSLGYSSCAKDDNNDEWGGLLGLEIGNHS